MEPLQAASSNSKCPLTADHGKVLVRNNVTVNLFAFVLMFVQM